MSDRPDTDDLVSKYPTHVPMGLPLPPKPKSDQPAEHDDDARYSL